MKKTILVVDDFAAVRQFVCENLEKHGYNTFGAANGNEAFDLLTEKTTAINLVLTDYHMPDCNGYELLKRIKSIPVLSAIPVVFLTAECNPEKIQSAKEAGLTAWIKKPFRSETFFAQIDNAMV